MAAVARGVTETVMTSPAWYSGLSSASSSMSACRRWHRRNCRRQTERRSPDRSGRRGEFDRYRPNLLARNACRLLGGRVHAAVGDAFGDLDRLVIPAAVTLIELITVFDPQQFETQPALRHRRTVRRHGYDIEGRVAASASERPENCGFTPIILPAGVTGSVMLCSTARPPGSPIRTVT